MGSLDATFSVEAELRPCLVDGKRALWHEWTTRWEIVPPSIMVGGHGGGQVSASLAVVEFEDGTVAEVYPSRVRFLDTVCKMASVRGAYLAAEGRGLIEKEAQG